MNNQTKPDSGAPGGDVDELLPCPFCGKSPMPADDWLLVECMSCNYFIDVPGYDPLDGPKEYMVKHWNTRAVETNRRPTLSVPGGDVEKMARELLRQALGVPPDSVTGALLLDASIPQLGVVGTDAAIRAIIAALHERQL